MAKNIFLTSAAVLGTILGTVGTILGTAFNHNLPFQAEFHKKRGAKSLDIQAIAELRRTPQNKEIITFNQGVPRSSRGWVTSETRYL
ncbi:MAG: hypothetical protein FWC27_12570 [Firmicutes bacterium]|nr:hypothetical protein [Bacillota bacterium]